MRRLIAIVLFLGILAGNARGETIRVTTWNLNWFPSGSPDPVAPELEAKTISDVASVLKGLFPDVVVLQEVRDWEACERLAAELGEPWQVLVCSSFAEGRNVRVGKRQVAILSKLPAEASWSFEWEPHGRIKPPGGFVFAGVRAGGALIGIYGVHLKNNLLYGNAERELQVNMLHREISSEQLLDQVWNLTTQRTNDFDALVIAGNFNTTRDQLNFVSEKTILLLEQAGFSNGFEEVPRADRVTVPGKGRYEDATFDYIFARLARFRRPPLIVSTKYSDHHPVTADLQVEAKPVLALVDQPAGAPLPAGGPPIMASAAPAFSPISYKSFILLLVPLMPLLALAAWVWRRAPEAPYLPDALAVPDQFGLPMAAIAANFGAMSDQEKAQIRARLLPYLGRALADKFVSKLVSQRAELVSSQQTAAAHMAEMEQRLAQVQPKIQARLEAYEKRIAELEKELTQARSPNPSGASKNGHSSGNEP